MSRLIRAPGVAEKLGQSISKTWNDAATDPEFPQPIKRGGITCWLESEVDAYIIRRVEKFRAGGIEKRATVFKAAQASAARRTGAS